MSRIWIRGSSMGVRVFAVGVLVSGIGVGATAGYLNKSGEPLSLKEVSAANPAELEVPPADTDKAQPLPVGARMMQVKQELDAEAKAKAEAQARADEALRLAKAQAERAATERVNRSKKKEKEKATEADNEATGPGQGEQPPPASADCTTYSGHRQTGCSLLSWAGFQTNQMGCLDRLWKKESGWSPNAHNKSSGAHGIPQALPGKKMAGYGADWATNPVVQIKWGLQYIKVRYKSPCAAWGHSQARGWY